MPSRILRNLSLGDILYGRVAVVEYVTASHPPTQFLLLCPFELCGDSRIVVARSVGYLLCQLYLRLSLQKLLFGALVGVYGELLQLRQPPGSGHAQPVAGYLLNQAPVASLVHEDVQPGVLGA